MPNSAPSTASVPPTPEHNAQGGDAQETRGQVEHALHVVAPERARTAPAAPSAPQVMAMLLAVSGKNSRADLARKALEAVGRGIESLKPQAEAVLAQTNILGDAEKLARAIATPELRTAFSAHFELVRDSEATERKEADLKTLRGSGLSTGQIRHYLELLRDKGFKGRPVAATAKVVLERAPEPKAEGGRVKLIELIGGNSDLLRVVADYAKAPKLRSATRMELEAHLVSVGDGAEKQVRSALRRMAEGSLFSDVKDEAVQVVSDLGGNVYEIKFSVILFALESYPHVCAALISVIKSGTAEKKKAEAPTPKPAPKPAAVAPVEESVAAPTAPKTPREQLNAMKNKTRLNDHEAYGRFVQALKTAVPGVTIPDREGRGAAITEAMKQLADAQVTQLLADFGTKGAE